MRHFKSGRAFKCPACFGVLFAATRIGAATSRPRNHVLLPTETGLIVLSQNEGRPYSIEIWLLLINLACKRSTSLHEYGSVLNADSYPVNAHQPIPGFNALIVYSRIRRHSTDNFPYRENTEPGVVLCRRIETLGIYLRADGRRRTSTTRVSLTTGD